MGNREAVLGTCSSLDDLVPPPITGEHRAGSFASPAPRNRHLTVTDSRVELTKNLTCGSDFVHQPNAEKLDDDLQLVTQSGLCAGDKSDPSPWLRAP